MGLCLSACLLALPAYAQSFGPPTVNQAPPFAVPEEGYAVEGRPGKPGSGFVLHYTPKEVPWEAFEAPGIGGGLQRKLMSQSPSMGAIAQITAVPAGWSQPAGYDDVDNEIILLEGDLSIGDEKLTRYSYSFMPAGVAHGATTSRQGAVMLQWYKGVPKFVASANSKAGARPAARIRDWNQFDAAWYVGEPFPHYRTGGNFPGALHKLIRKDPDTGEMTWITFGSSIPAPPSGKPSNFGGGYEIHPSFEEYFLLEKSDDTVIGECLAQGETPVTYGGHTYWWRPAGVAHGGPLSRGSNEPGYTISIVRTGTPLWATYVTDCSYKTGLEYLPEGWRKYDYDVPRYEVHD
ncbi:DUF4437 domain-containing protein [Sphingomonas crocodyli]|nr:DUF4437 domain-containing protein [Sphingomonas crocodyli]